MKQKTLRYRRILQAANHFCRAAGTKTAGVDHLWEKLSGERPFTWDDLDRIQAIMPPNPHLLSYWYSALCDSSVAPATPTVALADGASLYADPAPHPPLTPISIAKKEAA